MPRPLPDAGPLALIPNHTLNSLSALLIEITGSNPDRTQAADHVARLIQELTTLYLAPATDTGQVNIELTQRYTVPRRPSEAQNQYDGQIGRFYAIPQNPPEAAAAFDVNYSRTLMDQQSARINISGTFPDPRPNNPNATVAVSGTLNLHANVDRLIEAGKLLRRAARNEPAPAAQLVAVRALLQATNQLQVLPTSLDIGTIALWFAERMYTLVIHDSPIEQFVTETFIDRSPNNRLTLFDALIRLLNGPFTLSTASKPGAPGVYARLETNLTLLNGNLSCKATFLVPGVDGTTSVASGPAVTWNGSVRFTELEELRTIFRAILRDQALPAQQVQPPSALVRTATELWNALNTNAIDGSQFFNAARALFPIDLPCASCGTLPNTENWRDPADIPHGAWHHLNHLDIQVKATDAVYTPTPGQTDRQDFGYLRAEAKLTATANSKVRGAVLIALPSREPGNGLAFDPSFSHALSLVKAWRIFVLAPA
ncbi:MAG: hypothetical protein JNM72_24895 [Deltaproteobacteria bacterium]|nr:hypothetical protein [Deltaproteobacteria bacterium]